MNRATDPDYAKKHYRVYRKYGKAKDYLCDHCDGDARHWAHIHGTDGSNPDTDFMPLCISCHRIYDYTDEHRANVSKGMMGVGKGRKRTPEQRAALSVAHIYSPNISRNHSKEHNEKVSEGLRNYHAKQRS